MVCLWRIERSQHNAFNLYVPVFCGGGASIDYNSRPQIDFDGKWIKPFVEFYDGEPYWEAWFFTSGTLTLSQGYTIDAWCLGGGGANYRGDSSLAGAGMPAMALGCTVPAALFLR